MVGWLVFIFAFIFFVLFSKDKFTKRYSKWYYLLFIVVFTGFRYRIGYDYDSYTRMFFKTNELDLVEPTWHYLILIINIVTGNAQILFLISSIFIYPLIFRFVYKNSPLPLLSIYIFICFQYYFAESLSVLRQYIAVAIFLSSYKYILERNFKKFILLNIIGFSFHYSAIIAIPTYFFINKKFSNLLLIVVTIASFFFHTLLTFAIPQIEIMERYSTYLSGFELEANSGIDRIVRIVILLCLIFSKKALDYENNLSNRASFNLMFLGILIYTSLYIYAPFRRLSYYFMIFEIIIMAQIFFVYFMEKPFRLKAILFYLYIFFAALSFGKRWWPNKTDFSGTNTHYEMKFVVDKPIPLKQTK
ncbi:EpsG family protein [Mangrovibacterium sp.]|uniref:EpsG family protein n=1 Tax=Mangrovibacterium sp. TaxID=1961364 RepID=UPI0035661702